MEPLPQGSEVSPADVVAGRRIAVIGGCPEILDQGYGDDIESFDVVIRSNHSWPRNSDQERAIGRRTDVLTGGIISPMLTPEDLGLLQVWWLKHTPMGDVHLGGLRSSGWGNGVPIWHMPIETKLRMREEIGHDASSAPLIVDICREFGASYIEVFGISCWGKLERGSSKHWWGNDDRSRFHHAKAEAKWFRENSEPISPYRRRITPRP